MRVTVHLISDGANETTIEGEAPIFGHPDYKKGFDSRLRQLKEAGFWLEDWRYAGHSGPKQESRVFVPWTSCHYVETEERDT